MKGRLSCLRGVHHLITAETPRVPVPVHLKNWTDPSEPVQFIHIIFSLTMSHTQHAPSAETYPPAELPASQTHHLQECANHALA